MRWQWPLVAIVLAAALAVRILPAREAVYGGSDVNFLETDSWYHLRLIEHQVRNYPWRATFDPYAAPGGQFVAIAPLFDTLVASAVVVVHGRGATTHDVERIAALAPPVLGMLAVFAIFLVARAVSTARGGLAAAALAAVVPGHFLDRTMLGFVDHHALEAVLAVATLLVLARASETRVAVAGPMLAVTLGAYLLSWSSGAFLVAIVGMWLLLVSAAADRAATAAIANVVIAGAAGALALVLMFQDPRMHRYGSQIIGLLLLAAIAVVIRRVAAGRAAARPRRAAAAVAALAFGAAAAAWVLAPDVLRQVWTDVGRLAPDPGRMGVLEARPLFLYPGEWSWQQPWQFFRTGFYVGLIGLAALSWHVWRSRSPGELLVWTYGAATLAVTIGQNRFGYYLVTAFAITGGWLAEKLLAALDGSAWLTRGRWTPLLREAAIIGLAVAVFAPIVAPPVLLAPRAPSLTPYWRSATDWLRRETPPPFAAAAGAGDEYYFARYPATGMPFPDYTVMSWWDQGYWVVQRGRRVPVANPTQARAANAARFYVATDEGLALRIADTERVRFVLADWELPYRLTAEGSVMGRFQSVLDWAGVEHRPYYEVYYRRDGNAWIPQWIFHAAYYHSMAFRLTVLGGAAATPASATSVITVADRTDANGLPFRELLTTAAFATFEEAVLAAAKSPETALVVGLDPWRAAFPVPRLSRFRLRHDVRTPDQQPGETPWVRVFER